MNYIKFQIHPICNLETKFEIDNAISNFITSYKNHNKKKTLTKVLSKKKISQVLTKLFG